MKPDTTLEEVFQLPASRKKALAKLGLTTVRDLLFHFPARYTDTSEIRSISDLTHEKRATVYGRLTGLETGKARNRKLPYAKGQLEDDTGKLAVIWWNQPSIAKMYAEGQLVKLTGPLGKSKSKPQMSNPEIERASELPAGASGSLFDAGEAGAIYPVYPESHGVTSRWIYHAVGQILETGLTDDLVDPIPKAVLKKYSLPSLKAALFWIHRPRKLGHTSSARKRFSFEEVLLIQLSRLQARKAYEALQTFRINVPAETTEAFKKQLPFDLTSAQKKSAQHITADLGRGVPMSRLLEGDVGSGKTAVAALTSYCVVSTRPEGQDFGTLQVAYMAPTEVLARQLFESFIEFFSAGAETGSVQIGLITGSECRKFPAKVSYETHTHISKNQLLQWIERGEINIVIGTHSLIQKTVKFRHLALAIIDEQHRFGTNQRHSLAYRDRELGQVAPHLLSMTATPIPRTLALTIYGDLDLTLLDAMPEGRKPVKTKTLAEKDREKMYTDIRQELDAGRQVYVICPRIDEPDPTKENAVQAKSAKAEAERLKKEVFPEAKIDVLHSKETPKKKEEIMARFASGETEILVSTSVVEVGVNVPNATAMIIEGAERFGLASLHQLRGRVRRSTHQAYCYLLPASNSQKSTARLKALQSAKTGFELAEEDLKLRGAGELSGSKQWGVSDIGMEAIQNPKMVEAARDEAQNVLKTDPELKDHPELAKRMTAYESMHFE